MKQQLNEIKRMQQLAGVLNENAMSLPSDLSIGFSKRRGNYVIFAGQEGEATIPFSQMSRQAKEITDFINQLPDGKMTTDIEVSGGLEGLEIRCYFTTSLSKEELEQSIGKRIY